MALLKVTKKLKTALRKRDQKGSRDVKQDEGSESLLRQSLEREGNESCGTTMMEGRLAMLICFI